MDRSNILKQLASLSSAERMLLERRLSDSGLVAGEKNTISKRVASDCCALSFAQQRLWFLDQLEPNGCVYNLPHAWRLTGQLNIEAIKRSLDAIVSRHEAIRTIFVLQDASPIQVIRESRPVELSVDDLSEATEGDREAELQRLLREEARRPFNLAGDLMLRARLFRLGQDDHVLLCTMHHIATDGWSLTVFFEELANLYSAYCNQKPVVLPELPIQYADYAVWHRKYLQGEALQRQLVYWKGRLKGAPGLLNMPLDRPRSPVQTYTGARRSALLPKPLIDGLRALSQRQHGTLFMTMLAAWQILLYRYTNQTDLVIGVPTAGRKYLETEPLIGFFVNTLVFRTDLSGDPTYSDLLTRVSKISLEAYQNDDLPFEKLVEELQPERDLSHSPFFQVMFAFQNLSKSFAEMSGLKVTRFAVDQKVAKFDLTVSITNSTDALEAVIEYNTDLFDGETVERMLGHYQILLEGIVAKPEQRISELPLLSEAEKPQLWVVWNDTKREYPKDKCIHELFEEQVDRTPDAVAVVFEEQQLTYRELNARANQVAHRLKTLGLGPDVLVGICLERSLEMVIAVLAILKAGGAYVPLDPTHPAERLEFMLADSGAPFLLTEQRLTNCLANYPGKRLCIDGDSEAIAQESEENPTTGAQPEDLAYVIYTSGSTGKPKGVMIEHRSVVNFLNSMRHEPGMSEDDRLLAVTTLSFDIAGLEIYLPLTVGARVILASRAVVTDVGRLAGYVRDSGATVMQATPATWRMLLAAEWQGSQGLKVLCGGEALTTDLAKQLTAKVGSLWNMYGPTETTIYSLACKLQASFTPISLGRPIANTLVYILDAHLNSVPVSVVGEIYIGGDGVARGYLNRPELTAERFIQHSFDGESGQRLYRTGDLARYLPDGNIEFLGRIDDQVKIRGYRIELGEIETVLGQLAAVRSSVVVVREDEPGDKRLVGYVVARPEESFDAAEVRKYLKQKLPEYMIPTALVPLDAFPLTPNGKIDRGALPAPDQNRRELAQVYRGPRTPSEATLAAIWREVLKLAKVGIHDNFFDLGGHSLLATQVVSRIRSAFSIEFPLRSLFELPTIAEVAAMIEQNQPKQASAPELAQMLSEVEAMSDEEAQKIVAK